MSDKVQVEEQTEEKKDSQSEKFWGGEVGGGRGFKGGIDPWLKLTKRQKSFGKNYAKLYDKVDKPADIAMKRAYGDENGEVSHHMMTGYKYELLKNPKVRGYIEQLLEGRGLGVVKLGNDLRKAINKGLKSDNAKLGDAIKGIEMALKLHDAFPAKRTKTQQVTTHVDMASEDKRILEKKLQEVKEKQKQLEEEGKIQEGQIVEED